MKSGGDSVKAKLTLQEKLRDLRDERKFRLADLSEATKIPVSTLQRLESDEDIHASYQDIASLARFYDVSADYLFGLTDNRQHRNIEIDKLNLSDEAIDALKNGNLNNRLISEFLAHSDFPQLLSAMEVYIDRKILPQMNTLNALFKATESTIRENYAVADNDEVMAFLQQSVIDEDEYLRYRISERFNAVMKSLFDAHKKDPLAKEQAEVMNGIKENMQAYMTTKTETGSGTRAKMVLLARQLGLNLTKLTDEEIGILAKALESSELYRRANRRR